MKLNGTGGANTQTGEVFERITDLMKYFSQQGYSIPGSVDKKKHAFIRYVTAETGMEINHFWSRKLLPDEALVFENDIYIIEKKYQQSEGSTDEKPQTCGFKKWEYEKVGKALNKQVHFCYLFNDWFKHPRYSDMLEFINLQGCDYFFNTIPIDYFEGIEVYASK